MKSGSLIGLIAVWVMLMAGSPVAAQSVSAEPDPGGWKYTVAPYLWAPGMDGTITINRIEADVNVPFSDMLISGPQLGVAFHF